MAAAGRLLPPARVVLYAMIALAGWLVWREREVTRAAPPLGVCAVRLLLNGLWSPIFFGLRRLDLAFRELVLPWLSILACIILLPPIGAAAAWLLVPYLAWVSFAGVLNWTVWRMNRGADAA